MLSAPLCEMKYTLCTVYILKADAVFGQAVLRVWFQKGYDSLGFAKPFLAPRPGLEFRGSQGERDSEVRGTDECEVKAASQRDQPSAAGFHLLLTLQRKQWYT